MKVQAKTKEHPTPVEVEVNIPEGLDDQVKLFGKEVIASRANAALVIDVQAFLRRLIDKNADPKTNPKVSYQEEVKKWKPEVRSAASRMSAPERIEKQLEGLTVEEKQALVQKLQGMTGANAAKSPAAQAQAAQQRKA